VVVAVVHLLEISICELAMMERTQPQLKRSFDGKTVLGSWVKFASAETLEKVLRYSRSDGRTAFCAPQDDAANREAVTSSS
jgi:hypothetical protein